jgi:hypothetical protein
MSQAVELTSIPSILDFKAVDSGYTHLGMK